MTLDASLRDAVADAVQPLVERLAQLEAAVAAFRVPIQPVAYKVSEAAEALRVSVPTLSKIIDAGELPVVVLPGMTERRIPVAAVAALVAEDRWRVGNVIDIGRTA